MSQQTLTGNAKSLGAVAAGGTITVSPADYPQSIGGVLLSSVPVTGTIHAVTGAFSVSVMQGAKVRVRGKDGAGKTFLDVVITISSDATLDITSYLQAGAIPAGAVSYVASYNGRSGAVTPLFNDSPFFAPYHGILARTVTAPLPTSITTTTFTLGALATPISYYYQGQLVTVSADKSAVIPAPATAGIYFVYFLTNTGEIEIGAFPGLNLAANVLIASIWWNGTNLGLVNDERHGYSRSLPWHSWAHSSIGARWASGLDILTLTGTGATASMTLGAGSIMDEDILFSIGASSAYATPNTYRHCYQTSATTFAFEAALSTVPFSKGVNNRPNAVNLTGYALTQLPSAANRYINFFVYATTDVLCPIYIFAETATAVIIGQGGYTTVALAQAIPWPNLTGIALSAEMKPLYRIVVRADGAVQAHVAANDYRSVSSLPQSAGTTSTAASAVSYVPTAPETAVTIQQAIDEIFVRLANHGI